MFSDGALAPRQCLRLTGKAPWHMTVLCWHEAPYRHLLRMRMRMHRHLRLRERLWLRLLLRLVMGMRMEMLGMAIHHLMPHLPLLIQSG